MEKINRWRIVGFCSQILGAVIFLLSLFPFCANAISIINDEETEQYLQAVIEPIFRASNIPFNRNEIYIVNDPSLNAFVSDGNSMFVHTGTLMNISNTNELTGILAHESGHIKGGHILRQKIKLQNMQKLSLASLVLAGAAGVVSGRGDVAMAIMLGGSSSAIHSLTAHQVEEERSADEAAVNTLRKLHQSPIGLLNFMRKIDRQNKMQGREESPYFRTHPMTRERIAFLENAVKNSPYDNKSPLDAKLKRVQAKLRGFLLKPAVVRRIYEDDNNSINAMYALSIADLQEFKYASAMQKIDSLLKKEPNNPHFMELKGQIYLEQGKAQAARKEFSEALKIVPQSALFKYNLAQTVLESPHNKSDLEYNEKILNQALRDFPSAYGWTLLARTYDELNRPAERQYASAKYSFEIGEVRMAKKQIEQAKKYKADNKLKLKIDDLEHEIDAYLEENPDYRRDY